MFFLNFLSPISIERIKVKLDIWLSNGNQASIADVPQSQNRQTYVIGSQFLGLKNKILLRPKSISLLYDCDASKKPTQFDIFNHQIEPLRFVVSLLIFSEISFFQTIFQVDVADPNCLVSDRIFVISCYEHWKDAVVCSNHPVNYNSFEIDRI